MANDITRKTNQNDERNDRIDCQKVISKNVPCSRLVRASSMQLSPSCNLVKASITKKHKSNESIYMKKISSPLCSH